MLHSNLVLAILTFSVRCLAAPTVSANDLTNGTRHYKVGDLIVGEPLESGKMEEIHIPGLHDLELLDVNGTLEYQIPEGGLAIAADVYEKLTGKKPQAVNKRDCSGNPCACGTHRVWNLVDSDWSRYLGVERVMSSIVCGPGAISETYTATYSYTITGTLGTGFAPVEAVFKGITLAVNFGYTWGTAIATGYTNTCDKVHPCVATFRPYIGQVRGHGRWTDLTNDGDKICKSGIAGNVEIHVPSAAPGCSDTKCGPEGVWSHCYYYGPASKGMCHTIDKTYDRFDCPAALYPGGSASSS